MKTIIYLKKFNFEFILIFKNYNLLYFILKECKDERGEIFIYFIFLNELQCLLWNRFIEIKRLHFYIQIFRNKIVSEICS